MSIATTRFKTLLLREWLQHKWGWLLVMFAPLAITLLTLPFGSAEFGPKGNVTKAEVFMAMELTAASKLATVIWAVSVLSVLALSLLAMSFQVSGLARRDAQDRSLEFWMSLPGSHSEHLGATVLAHCLLVPMAALAAGVASGLLIAGFGVVKALGWGALAQVQWGSVFTLLLPVLARVLGGLPLFMLWILPGLLLLMAASAWLKRWGVAAVVLVTVLLAYLPTTRDLVRPWLEGQADGAGQAFFISHPEQWVAAGGADVGVRNMQLSDIWQGIGQDLLNQLGHLASAQFLSGLLLAGLCFAALVYKRKHML